MTYTILIDQRFAVANDLTIVQSTTLAACMTLPTWTNTITIDGIVWYQYSETKMVEDFPLLFGIPKRVYKNLKELADRGFLELSSFGRTKYLRFTTKCKMWNRNDLDYNETENGLKSRPKTDYNETENGLHDYIINNNNIRDNKEHENKFSVTTQSPAKQKFSEQNGLTPGNLNVKQTTIDKIDSAFEKLVFPIDDIEIKKLFFILCCSPKWKGKTLHALQMSLNKVQNYDRDFVLKLIEDSIAGGWQGLVFENTDKKYQDYLKSKNCGISFGKTTFNKMSEQERKEALEYLNM